MSAVKLLILKAVCPPGFTKQVILKDANGLPKAETVCVTCKVGDVIELNDVDLVKRYGVACSGLADRYIAAGIAARASSAEKVTKIALHGEFEDAESGTEKQAAVSAKANGGGI